MTYDLFETNEEMYPVIEAGAVSYDAVCPSDYMIQKMVENGLLAEINFENVPNIANIDPVYLEKSKAFDPENRYSVPYTWGTVGIIYNVQKLEALGVPAPTKWSDLWDERLKGEILMQDSVRDAFMVALKELGYSMNTTDVGELEEAKKLLLAQKPLVQAYVVDQVRDKMLNGELCIQAQRPYLHHIRSGYGSGRIKQSLKTSRPCGLHSSFCCRDHLWYEILRKTGKPAVCSDASSHEIYLPLHSGRMRIHARTRG